MVCNVPNLSHHQQSQICCFNNIFFFTKSQILEQRHTCQHLMGVFLPTSLKFKTIPSPELKARRLLSVRRLPQFPIYLYIHKKSKHTEFYIFDEIRSPAALLGRRSDRFPFCMYTKNHVQVLLLSSKLLCSRCCKTVAYVFLIALS